MLQGKGFLGSFYPFAVLTDEGFNLPGPFAFGHHNFNAPAGKYLD